MAQETTCLAAATPAADGTAVYALFSSGDLAALSPDGDLLWYRALQRDYPDAVNQVGLAASPVVYQDVLLVPMETPGDSYAAGLDKKTGKNRWKAARARGLDWVTPLVVEVGGKPAAVFQTEKEATAYDPETGKPLWTCAIDDPDAIPSPVAGDGLIFAAGKGYTALKPSADGATPEAVWTSPKLNTGVTTPVYHKGRLYGLVGPGVNCLDAKTGELKWQQRIKGPFWASPVVADGKLYAVNEEGTTAVIELTDEHKVLATNALGEKVLATPAVAGGALFLRSDAHLWCIAEKKEK
jgi:outer membrane protein assembly factor BamB